MGRARWGRGRRGAAGLGPARPGGARQDKARVASNNGDGRRGGPGARSGPGPKGRHMGKGTDPPSILCCKLNCTLSAATCVLRQRISDRQQTKSNRERGTASLFPSCTTAGCVQGQAVRTDWEASRPVAKPWIGKGHGHRTLPRSRNFLAQLISREQRIRQGLEQPAPTIDTPPRDEDEE